MNFSAELKNLQVCSANFKGVNRCGKTEGRVISGVGKQGSDTKR
jgi:hypothetical protein